MIDATELCRQAAALADADETGKALELCDKILLAEPDNFRALFVAGSVLLKADKYVQAIQLLKRVTEIKPHDHRAYGQLALALGEIHHYDASLRYAEKALLLKREAKTLADASFAHVNVGNWDKGKQYAQDALKIEPTLLDARVHLANVALAQRDWVAGWEGYKLTLRTKYRKEHQYGESVEWMGEPDAVVAVTGEQGLGDEMMAASVIPDAIKACRKFILDCDHRLADLFRRSFPEAIVVGQRREKVATLPLLPTHHKSLFGLAEMFRRADEDFPRLPYLAPNPDYVRMFLELFGDERHVGIAWSGGFLRTGREQRTAGLNAFLPLLRRGDATYISLQYKDDAEEVAAFERDHGIKVKRLPWVTMSDDIDLRAAFIACLDEVVGVHTTTLHLSSAMGIPTTTLVHRGSGWRYAPEELLWYPPSTQMWRKRAGESWRECIGRLAEQRKEQKAA